MIRKSMALMILGCLSGTALSAQVRGYNTAWAFPEVRSEKDWTTRAAELRNRILFVAGLLPLPPKTPLNPQISGRIERNGYSVEKVYFESLPGFFVTGNLYRPLGKKGPFPGVLSPHGHSDYGRLENNELFSEPGRAINLARQGYVVFSYDMVGYNDSNQVPHAFRSKNAELWSFSVLGLQLFNSIRGLDFLETLPEVDAKRLAATGASGGGTQTFLLTAVDERVKVAAPVNMISHYMQGGDNCENTAGLRLFNSNMEIAALAAPRPLLMVSATGDWTRDNMRLEFPVIATIYRLFKADDRIQAVQFHAQHNYNQQSREAVYAFLSRWLKESVETPKDVSFTVERPSDLLVWYGRPHPGGATVDSLLKYWSQLPTDPTTLSYAVSARWPNTPLEPDGRLHPPTKGRARGVAILAGREDTAIIDALNQAGFAVFSVDPYEEKRNTFAQYFTTYNRTADQLRVQQILDAAAYLGGQFGPVDLVGVGPGGPWALLARAVAPRFRKTMVDLGNFPTGPGADDQAYLDRLFIPGIRRAGGLPKIDSPDVKVQNGALTPKAVVEFLAKD